MRWAEEGVVGGKKEPAETGDQAQDLRLTVSVWAVGFLRRMGDHGQAMVEEVGVRG